jgi:hypothetical protein
MEEVIRLKPRHTADSSLLIPLRQDAGGFCENEDAAPQRILSSLPSDTMPRGSGLDLSFIFRG